MTTTMKAVTMVSRFVGQTIFAASARTCLTKSPGVVFATIYTRSYKHETAKRQPSLRLFAAGSEPPLRDNIAAINLRM